MNARELLPRTSRVHIAEVVLTLRGWPSGGHPAMLRGAICAELEHHMPGGTHVDWHGHDASGEAAQRPAPILYRTTPRPSVYLWGPRAHEHAALLAARLHALRLPGGADIATVEAIDVQARIEDVSSAGRRPYCYRLMSPLYPPRVAWARRPREDGPDRRAWAAFAVAASLRSALERLGAAARDVDAHIEDVRWAPRLPWRDDRVDGILATVYTPARLPDGMGIGSHAAYGFGELRLVGRPEWA